MKNKEVSLKKIEQIKNVITNVKQCAFTGDRKGFEHFMGSLEEKILQLEDLVNTEDSENLFRSYNSL